MTMIYQKNDDEQQIEEIYLGGDYANFETMQEKSYRAKKEGSSSPSSPDLYPRDSIVFESLIPEMLPNPNPSDIKVSKQANATKKKKREKVKLYFAEEEDQAQDFLDLNEHLSSKNKKKPQESQESQESQEEQKAE